MHTNNAYNNNKTIIMKQYNETITMKQIIQLNNDNEAITINRKNNKTYNTSNLNDG